jgi:uncharacterized protein YciI
MPEWVRTILLTGPLDATTRAAAGHREQLRELRRQGRLRASGALGRGEGFLEIFEAKALLEAEAIARSSPLIEEGLGAWTLKEWEEIDS